MPKVRMLRRIQPMKLKSRQNSLHLLPRIIAMERLRASVAGISGLSARMNQLIE